MARREAVSWERTELRCGRDNCETAAVVVLDELVAAGLGLEPSCRTRPGSKGSAFVAELPGLCEGHWREARPASWLVFSGVVVALAPAGVEVEAVEATVGEGEASRDAGAGGVGFAGGRRVGRRRAGDSKPAAAVSDSGAGWTVTHATTGVVVAKLDKGGKRKA